ncbi:GAF domain-containing protein, partial [Myxococcota bacterium]|nr:GAF domain-containing protein [Myxococcota bacterium]
MNSRTAANDLPTEGYRTTETDIAFVLQAVLEGTVRSTGEAFFQAAVKNLARALGMQHALVGRCDPETRSSITTLAVWSGDAEVPNFEYALEGTPCQNVIQQSTCAYPDGIQALFPEDLLLAEMNARSYVGTPLMLEGERPLGVLAVLDDRPIPAERVALARTVLEIFAARSAAELDRLDAHRALLDQQSQLEQLVAERTSALQKSMARLERSARLASLGTLASGVAHELNNPLGIIRLACDTIESDPDDRVLCQTALGRILENVDRCRNIVRSVQRFARSEQSPKAPVDINECLRTAVDLSRAGHRSPEVDVLLSLERSLPPVVGNSTELLQVFVNLLQNAVAVKGVRKVRIESGLARDGVAVAVHDDGEGIPESDLPYLFDPFFTTRLNEGGTGLGLSICHGIVREHG